MYQCRRVGTVMAERTPKERRKTLSSEVKLLEGAERSLLTEEDVEWSSEEMRASELWLIQVPRDVSGCERRARICRLMFRPRHS